VVCHPSPHSTGAKLDFSLGARHHAYGSALTVSFPSTDQYERCLCVVTSAMKAHRDQGGLRELARCVWHPVAQAGADCRQPTPFPLHPVPGQSVTVFDSQSRDEDLW
jgi:hypothetical protein